MEYQKVINLLGNAQNEPPKFRARNWIEINHKWQGTHNKDKQIKFKTSTIRSGLCDYRDVYILVSGTMTITGEGADYNAKQWDERNKRVIFKHFVPFTNCISEINKT